MIKVAVVGTQGVPARYGGFETLVENLIGDNRSPDIEYTVFCSSSDMGDTPSHYKGAALKYVPLHANGMQSIPYDIWSMMKSISGYDAILILGVSGCVFLPFLKLFSKSRIIVNIDGLEHRRNKWGKLARWVLKFSESVAVKFADVIIADNNGIKDYVTQTYGKESVMIAYGGDHVRQEMPEDRERQILEAFEVEAGKYAVTVCRIEPENNCHRILEAFSHSDMPIVFIGNWNKSPYGMELKAKYSGHQNILICDPVYDIDKLYALRKNAAVYIHGHSAGGTNPSLVEAMFFGRPILCYDCVYNRESTFGQARYWRDEQELLSTLKDELNDNGNIMSELAMKHYTWRNIAHQYESLY